MEDFDSRWACPKCGSKDVEIALPVELSREEQTRLRGLELGI